MWKERERDLRQNYISRSCILLVDGVVIIVPTTTGGLVLTSVANTTVLLSVTLLI